MPVLLAITAFLVMEPVTCLVHRVVMHRWAWALHAGHHRPHDGGLEANDLFPVMFAALVMLALFAGFQLDIAWIIPAAVGVTTYGAAYGLVHDGYIHRRLGPVPGRHPHLERLAEAHRLHHRYGGAPYGMLFPVVASGSRPAHRPVEP